MGQSLQEAGEQGAGGAGEAGEERAGGTSSKKAGSGRNGGKYISQSKKRYREEGKKKEARARNASNGGWEV